MSWMNLPLEYCGENSKFAILPIEYEQGATFGKGAGLGSKEIIKASEHLEYYDEEFDCEPFLQGIKLLNPVIAENPKEMIAKVSESIEKNKFVIGLGGDHAVTLGLTCKLENDVSIIILDAHADFRDSWNNSTYNHACVSKQLSKKHYLALIGVRAMDIDEWKEIKKSKNVHLVKAHNYTLEQVKQILPLLKEKVYISLDADVFGPSFIRNTGTPEPGGLSWKQVIEILKEIFQRKEVVGCDIVEFAPEENYRAEAYSLARLAYKMMAMKKTIK